MKATLVIKSLLIISSILLVSSANFLQEEDKIISMRFGFDFIQTAFQKALPSLYSKLAEAIKSKPVVIDKHLGPFNLHLELSELTLKDFAYSEGDMEIMRLERQQPTFKLKLSMYLFY